MLNIPAKELPELRRAYANHKWEDTEQGIRIAGRELFIGSSCETRVNGTDPLLTHNIIPTAGRRHLLFSAVSGASQQTSYYIAAFANNATPVDGWLASNIGGSGSAIEEFTDYAAGTRPLWQKDNHGTASSVTNDANPAAFTLSDDAHIYGFLLVTNSAKTPNAGYNTGTLVSAIRNERANLVSGDALSARLTLVYQNVS